VALLVKQEAVFVRQFRISKQTPWPGSRASPMLSTPRSGKLMMFLTSNLSGKSFTHVLVTLQRRAKSRGCFSSARVRGRVDVVEAGIRVRQSRTGFPRVRGAEPAFLSIGTHVSLQTLSYSPLYKKALVPNLKLSAG
jgi:hypothetical protein